jgi:hypothetical protein
MIEDSETTSNVSALLELPKKGDSDVWRQPFSTQARVIIGQLRDATGWDEAKLLSRVGCEEASIDAATKGNSQRRCEHSLAYIGWLLKLAGTVDLQRDACGIVNRGKTLFFATDGDLAAARKAMRMPLSPTSKLSPELLLPMGEIDLAFDHAMRSLPGEAGELARGDVQHNAFVDPEHPAHLSDRRVRLLNTPGAEKRLGPTVTTAMREHITSCPQCGPLYAS